MLDAAQCQDPNSCIAPATSVAELAVIMAIPTCSNNKILGKQPNGMFLLLQQCGQRRMSEPNIEHT